MTFLHSPGKYEVEVRRDSPRDGWVVTLVPSGGAIHMFMVEGSEITRLSVHGKVVVPMQVSELVGELKAPIHPEIAELLFAAVAQREGKGGKTPCDL